MRHTWSQDYKRLGAHQSCAHNGTDWYSRQKPGEATDGDCEGPRAGKGTSDCSSVFAPRWSLLEQLVPAAQSFETACKALLVRLSSSEQLLAELRLGPKGLEESLLYLQVWPRLGVGVHGMSQAQCLVFVHRRCVRGLWHVPETWKGFYRPARGWQSFSLVSGPHPCLHSGGQPPQARSAKGSYFEAH